MIKFGTTIWDEAMNRNGTNQIWEEGDVRERVQWLTW